MRNLFNFFKDTCYSTITCKVFIESTPTLLNRPQRYWIGPNVNMVILVQIVGTRLNGMPIIDVPALTLVTDCTKYLIISQFCRIGKDCYWNGSRLSKDDEKLSYSHLLTKIIFSYWKKYGTLSINDVMQWDKLRWKTFFALKSELSRILLFEGLI